MSDLSGFRSRYDATAPSAVRPARWNANEVPAMDFGYIFCAKCQQNKPKKGHKRRGPLFICVGCL